MGKGVKKSSLCWLNTLQSAHTHTHVLVIYGHLHRLSELVPNVKRIDLLTDLLSNKGKMGIKTEHGTSKVCEAVLQKQLSLVFKCK